MTFKQVTFKPRVETAVSDSSSSKSTKPRSRHAGNRQLCPVAHCQEVLSRAHAATHLPGIFDDRLEPTEELVKRRISALCILESMLLGTVSDLMGLVTFINQLRKIEKGHYHVSGVRRNARGLCDNYMERKPPNYSLLPQPIQLQSYYIGKFC